MHVLARQPGAEALFGRALQQILREIPISYQLALEHALPS